jgi:hypothetical protein
MEQHDIVKEEQAATCLRVEFVKSDSREDENDDQISVKI